MESHDELMWDLLRKNKDWETLKEKLLGLRGKELCE